MWRGVSLKKLLLLIFGPMLVETMSMFILFGMVTRCVDAGMQPRQHMFLPLTGALVYSLSAFMAGRWILPSTAPWLLLATIPAAGIAGTIGLMSGQFIGYLVAIGCVGLCLGHYYVPFQIYLGQVQPFRTLAWSIAVYNVAWGTGATLGPFTQGLLSGESSSFGFLVMLFAVLVGLHTGLLALAMTARTPPGTAETPPKAAFASTPRLRLAAWLCFGAAGLAFRGLYGTLWPDLAVERHWGADSRALGLLLMALPIPLLALLWARLRLRFQRPWLLLGMMIPGTIGMVALPFLDRFELALAAVIAVGIAESCSVFCVLFFSNADPDPRSRARSVGISEGLAGSGFVTGPILLGTLAWDSAANLPPYIFSSVLMVLATVAATWVLYQERRAVQSAASPQ